MSPTNQLYTMEQSPGTARVTASGSGEDVRNVTVQVLADPLFCTGTLAGKAFQRAEDVPNGMTIRLDSRSTESTGATIASEFGR